MACSKCRQELEKTRLQATFQTTENGLKVVTISFKLARILISEINKSKVRVKQNTPYDVYAKDLHKWINDGVNGIAFLYPDQEEDFLATYSDIRKFHYS